MSSSESPDPTTTPSRSEEPAGPEAPAQPGEKAEATAPTFGVHLSRTDENVDEITALGGVVGGITGLGDVLDDLKWQARRSLLPRLLGRAVSHGFSWDRYDQRDRRWWPQGISSADDATDPALAGRRILVTTWYSKNVNDVNYGSRITFLDLDTLKYRHVLLVDPVLDKAGKLSLKPLKIHAGGLVWVGPYLHIAATARGFVTCRVEDIMRVPGDDPHDSQFGILEDRVASYGHRFVLPVRFRYRAHSDEGHQELRYSFLSLDRDTDPPGLVAGEYGNSKQTTRLARYELDPTTGLLRDGDDGFSRPMALDDGGVVRMQGAAVVEDRYHLSISRGPVTPGTIYVGRPGQFDRRRWAVPMGPEDLSYSPSGDLLWSVSEHPRRRWVYAMKRSWFDKSRRLD